MKNTFLAIIACTLLSNALAQEASDNSRLAEAILLDGRQIESPVEPLFASSPADFIRWGNPAPIKSSEQILLADGSLLVPSQAWSPTGKIQLNETQLELNRGGKSIAISRSEVSLIQLQTKTIGEADDLLAIASKTDFDSEEDLVTLVDGDLLKGKIKAFDGKQLQLELYGEVIELPSERIATLHLGRAEQPGEDQTSEDEPNAKYLVGLADGSVLKASRFEISANQYRIEAISKLVLEGAADEIVFVQSLGENVSYLSDLEPIDYQHTPYFSLEWPYGNDLLPVEGRLQSGGRYFAKGITMHTASRLVYALDAKAERFQAAIGMADNSSEEQSLGSALFRVFLVEAEGIRPLYESPILRTVDTLLPIDLNVAGARALVLTVDYADGADIGDNALWLDARLITSTLVDE